MKYTNVWPSDSPAALRATARALLPHLSWRHHGIGALQGYVTEGGRVEVRLHIWSPELVKPGMADSGSVHDHRFFMVSHVLAGIVGHDEWQETEHEDGDHETLVLTHARAAADSKFHGPVTPTRRRYFVEVQQKLIGAGSSYSFQAGRFHRSSVPAFAVTCVEKHDQRDDLQARVLHPVATPPIMAFGHDMDTALVAKLVARAAEALS